MSEDYCPHGCYWDCEHRRAPQRDPIEDSPLIWQGDSGTLRWCAECASPFYDAVAHARKHQAMRQLGWLS